MQCGTEEIIAVTNIFYKICTCRIRKSLDMNAKIIETYFTFDTILYYYRFVLLLHFQETTHEVIGTVSVC